MRMEWQPAEYNFKLKKGERKPAKVSLSVSLSLYVERIWWAEPDGFIFRHNIGWSNFHIKTNFRKIDEKL